MTATNSGSSKIAWQRVLLLAVCLTPVLFVSTACRQDMHDQPKYKPLRESPLFPDGRSARPLVEGTVARGYLRDDVEFYTGKTAEGSQPVPGGIPVTAASLGNAATYAGFTTTFPIPIDKAALDRGQERYNIYCSVCHGKLGDGQGMIPRRGYRQPPTYHQDRLRQAPSGYFFDVITNGFGAMPDYAEQIPAEDRWKIIAYIRALQLSQQGTTADVPPGTSVSAPTPPQPEAKEGERN
jgi:mono/diheme cytochrome c family protein